MPASRKRRARPRRLQAKNSANRTRRWSVVQISNTLGCLNSDRGDRQVSHGRPGACCWWDCLPKACRICGEREGPLGLISWLGSFHKLCADPRLGLPLGAGGAARGDAAGFLGGGNASKDVYLESSKAGPTCAPSSSGTPRSVRPWVWGAAWTTSNAIASIASTAGSRHSNGGLFGASGIEGLKILGPTPKQQPGIAGPGRLSAWRVLHCQRPLGLC